MSSIHDFIGRCAVELLAENERRWWGSELEALPRLCFLPDHHLDAQGNPEKEEEMRRFCVMPDNQPIPHTPTDMNGNWCVFTGSGLEDIMVEKVASYYVDKILDCAVAGDMYSAARFTGAISHYIQDNSVPVHVINNMLMNRLFPEKNGRYVHYHRIVDGLHFDPAELNIKPALLGTNREELVFYLVQGIKKNRENAFPLLVPLISAIDNNDQETIQNISQQYNGDALQLTVSLWHTLYALANNDIAPEETKFLQSCRLSRMIPVIEINPVFDRENFRRFGIDFYPTFYKQCDPDRSYIGLDPYRFEPALNKVYGKNGEVLPVLLQNGDAVEEFQDCIAVSGYGLSVFDVPGKIYNELTVIAGFHPISASGRDVRFSILFDCADGLQLAFQEDKKEHGRYSDIKLTIPENCRRILFIVTGGTAASSVLWCNPVIRKR